MIRQTYAEIDLGAIKHNIRLLKECARTEVMAVVKADGYGHGMKQVALAAYEENVRWFAVATAGEALDLRSELPDAGILILSYPEEQYLEELISNGISVTAYTMEQMAKIHEICSDLGLKARIHLAIDTGMNRIGIKGDEDLIRILDFMKKNGMDMEGVFTHFATADEGNKSFTVFQLEGFRHAVDVIKANGFDPIVHASNSAATIEVIGAHFDMCRMGISMYGYAPSGEVDIKGLDLRPALKLKSYVTHKKVIEKGETVSYGRHHEAMERETILTVPIGYADGYHRSMSGKAMAEVHGIAIQNVGNICMDQTMFLIKEGEDSVRVGDEVVLIGDRFNAESLAEAAGTISYEILTSLSKRVPRVYVDKK